MVVVKNPSQPDKKRLCVDYSQTINQYTELDAYPLPRIDDMINNLAHYKVFSTFDLRNAYHQVPILKDDRKYTGFEANGRLYQFRRIPFGVTNGVAVFQRLMDNIIKEEKLKDTFPYLDDITVAGVNQADHDKNVEAFLDVVKRQNLTLNHAKSVISASSINVLGYLVRDGNIRPDPERLRPLKELPRPTNVQSLRRTLGLFAYYTKWIPEFSSKIQSLVNAKEFPLSTQAENAFNAVKKELEVASLNPIDEAMPFVDDITVAGVNQADHDKNVEAFLDVVKRQNLTLNHAKSVISASSINVLGYLIRDGNIRPDPERLRPLKELPLPTNVQSLRRTLGLFAYYTKWIPEFSSKIQSLVNAKEFPLSTQAENAFNAVKKELEIASLNPIDEAMPFVVECGASESTISATLNQAGRPVAFMSRTLQGSELHYPAVEKEATAIIEAVRKWSDFLLRREFHLITDQRSVAFMLDKRKRTKIKNNKIQGWRLELA